MGASHRAFPSIPKQAFAGIFFRQLFLSPGDRPPPLAVVKEGEKGDAKILKESMRGISQHHSFSLGSFFCAAETGPPSPPPEVVVPASSYIVPRRPLPMAVVKEGSAPRPAPRPPPASPEARGHQVAHELRRAGARAPKIVSTAIGPIWQPHRILTSIPGIANPHRPPLTVTS